MSSRSLRGSLLGAGLLLVAALVGHPPPAAAQVELKAKGGEVCFPCHAELKDRFAKGQVHAPVAMGGCESCHNPHAARFPKLLSRKGADLCFTCHADAKAKFSKKVVHRPVKDGECTACHDPHAGPEKFQLKKAGSELCLTCHAKLTETPKKVSHQPFKDGECLLCHNPHASDQAALLNQASTSLCQGCHDLEDARLKRAHAPFSVASVACQQCHNPHNSDYKGLFKTVSHPPFVQGRCGSCHQVNAPDPRQTFLKGKEMCLTCHTKMVDALKKTTIHAPVADGQCTACHAPHGSEVKGMLVGNERQTCLGCHGDVEERFNLSRSYHPEKAGEGRCTICHVPHSADRPKLAANESLKVCASCHGSHAALAHPMGAGVIDPRTEKTLDCLSCHDVHGTALPMLLTHPKERTLCLQCHKALR